MTDDVLRNEHLDHVSRILTADMTDVVDEGVGDLAIRGSDDLEGDVDVLLVPTLQQAVRDVGIDVDDDGFQESWHGTVGRAVQLQLLGHRVVVLLDPRHEDVDQGHGNECEVGTVDELRRQDDDQDDTSSHQADAVDDPRVLPPAALLDRGRGVGAQQPRPVAHHSGLAHREGDEDANHVQLDQRSHRGVEDQHEDDGAGGQRQDAVGVGQTIATGVQTTG